MYKMICRNRYGISRREVRNLEQQCRYSVSLSNALYVTSAIKHAVGSITAADTMFMFTSRTESLADRNRLGRICWVYNVSPRMG